jgi:hypothetical protein
MLNIRRWTILVMVSCIALFLAACDKKTAEPESKPEAKTEAAKSAPDKAEAPTPKEAPKAAGLDPKNPPEKLAKIMKVKDGLSGVAPFSKYRKKVGELLGEPTRKGEMYDKPLHEWAAAEGNLCVHYKQIQEDPKAKVWTGWNPDMLVKPKDDSDMFASRNWQDCLDAAVGKPKK